MTVNTLHITKLRNSGIKIFVIKWNDCDGYDLQVLTQPTAWDGKTLTGEKLTVRVAVTGKCPYVGISMTAVVQAGKELND